MRITSGIQQRPLKCVIYGPEGVGKTTFASKFPDTLFIDSEGGSSFLDVRRTDSPKSWTELIGYVTEASVDPPCRTLVIDTIDWAEQLCLAHVCKKKNVKGIEDLPYGKGFTYANEEIKKLLDLLTDCTRNGVNVVICAHAQIKRFAAPDEMGEYDRWELKLQKKDAQLVKEWCDLLLFANYANEIAMSKDGKTVRATGGKKRTMYATHSAAYDAKNRLGLPDSMPFDFAEIADKVPADIKPAEQQFVPDDEAEAQAGAEAAANTKKDGPSLEEMDAYLHEIANGNMNAKPPEFEEVTEPEFAQLHQLMADYQVSEAQLRDAVGSRKNNDYTDATPIGDYSIEFVRNTLLKHWEKIVATIKERGELYKDIPF